MSLLADTLSALVPATGKTGIPMGLESHLRMPSADFLTLQARIAPRKIADGAAALYRVRVIKSEAEIAKIRAKCAIAAMKAERPRGAGLLPHWPRMRHGGYSNSWQKPEQRASLLGLLTYHPQPRVSHP